MASNTGSKVQSVDNENNEESANQSKVIIANIDTNSNTVEARTASYKQD